jgi:hypothetical protein
MEENEALVLALGAVSGALLLAIAVLWRRMIAESASLPLWHFLRREGILPEDAASAVSAKTVKQAELACSVCGSRQECRGLLSAAGAAMPPANCPNARLFREFNLWTNRSRP